MRVAMPVAMRRHHDVTCNASPYIRASPRLSMPSRLCEDDDAGAGGDSSTSSTSSTAVASTPLTLDPQCRDKSLCSWDCFSSSLITTQCGVDEAGTASYAEAGQLCAEVSSGQAACSDTNCMSPVAMAGFYRLTVDINCDREMRFNEVTKRNSKTNLCQRDAAMPGGVKWKRPESAKRAMGTNTIPLEDGETQSRCPVERWEPLTEPAKCVW